MVIVHGIHGYVYPEKEPQESSTIVQWQHPPIESSSRRRTTGHSLNGLKPAMSWNSLRCFARFGALNSLKFPGAHTARFHREIPRCETYLGPAGFSAVQISPPTEHVIGDSWSTRFWVIEEVKATPKLPRNSLLNRGDSSDHTPN
jgi:hypothetical protein